MKDHNFNQILSSFINDRLMNETSITRYKSILADLEQVTSVDFLNVSLVIAHEYRKELAKRPLNANTKDEYLRILKSIGTYTETKIPGYISPFTSVAYFSEITAYTDGEIPTMKQVSDLLAEAERTENIRGFLAATLAFRLCLTNKEIIALRREHFRFMLDGECFLKVLEGANKERTIPVPHDVVELISNMLPTFFNSTDDTPLLLTRSNKPLSTRTLSRCIQQIYQNTNLDAVTLSEIRSLGILLLLQEKNDVSIVREFLGISDRWLFRYEKQVQNPISSISLPNIHIYQNQDNNSSYKDNP